MEIYIYKLIDPSTNEVRYVGKTGNLKNRYTSHICNAKKLKSRLANWIKSLAKQNLQPVMEIIEICNEYNWEEREVYWINVLKTDKLCNVHSGGRLSCRDFIPKSNAKKYDLHKGYYRVRCSYLNKVYYIGSFDNPEEAVKAYDNFYSNPSKWILENPRLSNNQNHNKKVYVYDKNLKYITSFDSVSKCAEFYKIDSSSIADCCRGKLKTYKKMIFKYNLLKEESK